MALTYNNSSPVLSSMLQFTTENEDKPTELLAVNVENLNDLDRFIGVQRLFEDLRSSESQSDNNKVVDYGSFYSIYKSTKERISTQGTQGIQGPSGNVTSGIQGPVGPMGGIQTVQGISFQTATLDQKFEEISRLLSTVGIQFTRTSLSYPEGTIIVVGRDLHSHNGYIEL